MQDQDSKGRKSHYSHSTLQATLDIIVDKIIKAFFIVCIPLTGLSLARIIKIGFLPVMGLHIFLLLLLSFCFAFRRKLPSSFLSSMIVLIFFLIALGGFFTYKLPIYLAAGTILSLTFAVLLLSKKLAFTFLFCEATILLISTTLMSTITLTQSYFEVVVYCVFSSFVIFAIDRVKVSFLLLINNLNEKEKKERQTNIELNNALESKSKFLALMSHEIRTPLNSILLASEHLQELELNEEQQEMLNIIDNSNNSVQSIINNILDFTKAESKKMILEEKSFDLRSLVKRVKKSQDLQAGKKNLSISLTYHCPQDLFIGDETRIEQILVNLISNSIKFTSKGVIGLSVSFSEVTKEVHFTVSDSGVGIDPKRLDAVFHEFEQEDNSTTRLFGGTGLGLAIVHQLVTLMGGRIELSSQKGEGSEFKVLLPLKKSIEGEAKSILQAPPTVAPSSYLTSVKVLLFEDNLMNANLLKKRLQKLGINLISTASNGKEGLELMKHQVFDIIFMDIQMPVLNGIETTKAIRNESIGDNQQSIVIIGLSANSFREDIQKALEAGMNDYLSKPAKKESILEILDNYFS
jgi:signal transduction histidine kinase/CheY-like chemotaxis protein